MANLVTNTEERNKRFLQFLGVYALSILFVAAITWSFVSAPPKITTLKTENAKQKTIAEMTKMVMRVDSATEKIDSVVRAFAVTPNQALREMYDSKKTKYMQILTDWQTMRKMRNGKIFNRELALLEEKLIRRYQDLNKKNWESMMEAAKSKNGTPDNAALTTCQIELQGVKSDLKTCEGRERLLMNSQRQ